MTPTKDERRQEILAAALAAFAENGYAKTTMDDIVQRSGLSKGTLYWHFKNKEELFIATIVFAFQDMETQLTALVAQEDQPAQDRLRAFLGQAGTFILGNKQFVGLLVDAFFQAYQNEAAMDTMRTMYQGYIEAVKAIIQQGIARGEFRDVDPYLAAVALMAGGDGIALYMLMDPNWNTLDAFNTIIDLVLRGLQK